MFDGNIIDPYMIFIHLKNIKKLSFKTPNIIKPIKIKLFFRIRLKRGGSYYYVSLREKGYPIWHF